MELMIYFRDTISCKNCQTVSFDYAIICSLSQGARKVSTCRAAGTLAVVQGVQGDVGLGEIDE
jgi:hypothetical protein